LEVEGKVDANYNKHLSMHPILGVTLGLAATDNVAVYIVLHLAAKIMISSDGILRDSKFQEIPFLVEVIGKTGAVAFVCTNRSNSIKCQRNIWIYSNC
jgi:hypothetical protein